MSDPVGTIATTPTAAARARTATGTTFPLPASARVATTAARSATSTGTTAGGGSAAGLATSTGPASTESTQAFHAATTPVRAHAHGSGHVSTEAIALAAVAAVLVLATAVWALARSQAYEPHWLVSLRHAMAEAGYRMSATWAEFMDWARLGR
jgi:hypothetical protein